MEPSMMRDLESELGPTPPAPRTVRNIVWNYAGYVYQIAINLGLTWYIVRQVSVVEYGLFLFIMGLSAALYLLDMGLSSVLVQAFVEASTTCGKGRVNDLLGTTFLALTALGALGVLIFCGLAAILPGPFNIPHAYLHEASQIFVIAGFIILAGFPAIAVEQVYQASHRFDRTNQVQLGAVTVLIVLSVVVLATGHGIVGLALVQLLVALLRLVVLIAALPATLPGIHLSFTRFSYGLLKPLIHLSKWAFLSNLSAYLFDMLVWLILGSLGSMREAALFGLAGKPAKQLWNLVDRGANVTLPVLSKYSAEKDALRLRQTYLKTQKLVFGVILPFIVLGCVFARPFILVWAGAKYAGAALVMQWLLLAALSQALTYPSDLLLYACGEVKQAAKISVVSSAISILAALLLVSRYGAAGLAAGMAVTQLIFNCGWFTWAACRISVTSPAALLRAVFAGLQWPIAALAAEILIARRLVLPVFSLAGCCCCRRRAGLPCSLGCAHRTPAVSQPHRGGRSMIEDLAQSQQRLRCSVVVATWQRPVLLRNTLASLLGQSYPDFEVVVVCDGEDDGVRAISREFEHESSIRWIFHPVNRGLPAARNTGAREAQGDVVLFLDDDVIAHPDLLSAHMGHHLKAAPGCRLAVTSLAAEERQTQLSTYLNERLHEHWKSILESLSQTLSAPGLDSIGDEIEKIVCFGLNSSIRRDLFLSYGGFNEVFRASDEESELGIRLYLAGFDFVFEPRFLLTHKNSKDLTEYFRGCWRASGALDIYRVFELGQRNSQTRHLVSMYHGYLLNRLAARAAWHLSGPLLTISKTIERRANRSRSPLLFSLWGRTVRAGEYWNSAKADGCTLSQLKRVSGSSRVALTLHSLSAPDSDEEASYYLSPHRFKKMMRWFITAGYKTATIAQWLRDDLPRKRVLLTFDDGYDDLFTHLLPLVIEHRLTPVIFLVADRIGASNFWDQRSGLRARNLLTWPQIREMQKHGIEFGSHTLTHPFLREVSDEQLRCEVVESKRRLEDALGLEVASFAYPYGGVDRRVRAAVAEAGYKVAFTTLPGPNWWNDPLCQRRAEINDRTTLLDFAFQLRTAYGFTQSISERLGSLERDLPIRALRNTAGALRSFGHYVRHDFARGSRRGGQG
jgi:O-antigen/teichoic acid export membrane protein/GT2 family glycosyltransferase/peptidoglycan/xylan/chitin deacetylase (PgdA/CDA1 family)